MPRLPLLAIVAALLASGCRAPNEGDATGSPGGSIAGTETRHDLHRPGAGAQANTVTARAGSSRSPTLTLVTTTAAADAQPCERVCGSLGDCLRTDSDHPALTAGGLELECLDRCVHSPADSPAKADFLACGTHDECGPLRTCATEHWAPLAGARHSPTVSGVAVSNDPCRSGCRWLYACMFTNMPPGEAYLDPQLEIQMNTCMDECDGADHLRDVRDAMIKLANCLPTHCSADRLYDCLN